MIGENFSLQGGGLAMGLGGVLEPPGTTQVVEFVLTPGPSGSILTFNGDRHIPPAGSSVVGSLDFKSAMTFPTVQRGPGGGFLPIAPVTLNGPFTMTGHLQGLDTRTSEVTTFDLTGSGIALGQFGLNSNGGPPLEGNFIVRSAQYTFIPEPSTWLLLSTGLAALLMTKRLAPRSFKDLDSCERKRPQTN
jgi:hypothetical protein